MLCRDPEGIFGSRTIKRLPVDERWNVDYVRSVKGTPWEKIPRNGEPVHVLMTPEFHDDIPDKIIPPDSSTSLPIRRVRLNPSDFKTHGFTPNCPGCKSILIGDTPRNHTDQCRERMESALNQTSDGSRRIKHVEERTTRIMARSIEEQEKRKRAKTLSSPSVAPGSYVEGGSSGSGSKRAIDDKGPSDSSSKIRKVDVSEQQNNSQQRDEEGDAVMGTGDTQPRGSSPPESAGSAADVDGVFQKQQAEVCAVSSGIVTELYSPPRVSKVASKYGLLPGHAFDIICQDSSGDVWDLSRSDKRNAVVRLIHETKPSLLIGSPMCRMFSILQNINKNNRDENEFRKQYKDALSHLEFCLGLYHIQQVNGRYYLHEHPNSATSWKVPCMINFIKQHNPGFAYTNMCAFGMQSSDEHGAGLVYKPIKFISNSWLLINELSRHVCNGRHRHVHLMGGRAAAAAIYPDKLCVVVCKGIADQLEYDELYSRVICRFKKGKNEICSVSSMQYCHNDEEDFSEDLYQGCEFYDDVSGGYLDKTLVSAARKIEMEFFKKMKLYEYSTVEECWRVTGKAPIGTRWVDTNKGDSRNPDVRCRLVAQEINRGHDDDLYAATPPIEALKA